MESHIQNTEPGAVMSRSGFGDWLITMFVGCLSRGMTLPFTVCYAGRNGSVNVARLSDLDNAMESMFTNAERFELPVNVMVVDRDSHAFISVFDPGRLH